MNSLPAVFQTTLIAYVKQNYLKKGRADSPWNKKDTYYFAKGVQKLHDDFALERSNRHSNYFDDPVRRSGYLVYFFPVNLMKVYVLCQKHDPVKEIKEEYTIADIGAGPLTASFGFLLYLLEKIKKSPKDVTINICAIEQNAKILKDGMQLMQAFLKNSGTKCRVQIRSHAINLNRQNCPRLSCDFIFFGNVLNEFYERAQQLKVTRAVLSALTQPNTQILFLEPGHKKTSRDLQTLRDILLQEDGYQVTGPCLHQQKCPLNLVLKKDWCHSRFFWEAPLFIHFLDKAMGLKKEHLLYSYLWVNRSGKKSFERDDEFVAITDSMKMKSKTEFMGCGVKGYVRFVLFHGEKLAGNFDERALYRGQRFSVSGLGKTKDFLLNEAVKLAKNNQVRFLEEV